jgi:demethylmenaquinone methyltransferase/2-methoxy-6-polyprenyl-1,4-benzoquinol methylase
MVSFGVRNFENLEQGLSEIFRVLRPGGMLMVLEFSKPSNPVVKALYHFYNQTFLPFTGRLLSSDKAAYSYLPESVEAFPEGRNFLQILTKQHFQHTKALPLTFGISTIYTGIK